MSFFFPDIAGDWRGHYRADVVDGFRAAFTMRLRQAAWGVISGDVVDDIEGADTDFGTIGGRIVRRGLRFTKQMPRFLIHERGRVFSLSEWTLPDGTRPFADHLHTPLDYRGRLQADGSLAGRWTMPATTFRSSDRRTVTFPETHGTWTARRMDSQRGL